MRSQAFAQIQLALRSKDQDEKLSILFVMKSIFKWEIIEYETYFKDKDEKGSIGPPVRRCQLTN